MKWYFISLQSIQLPTLTSQKSSSLESMGDHEALDEYLLLHIMYVWVLGIFFSQKEWWCAGTGCLGWWWSHHPWRYSRDMWMCHWGTWFSDGTWQVRLMVRLNNRNSLFQPDPMSLWFYLATVLILARNILPGIFPIITTCISVFKFAKLSRCMHFPYTGIQNYLLLVDKIL